MGKRIISDVLKSRINKKTVLILKNGYRFEGIVLDLDEDMIKFDDRKIGITSFSLDDIKNVRGIR